MNKTAEAANKLATQLVETLKDKGAILRVGGTYVVVMSSLDRIEEFIAFARKAERDLTIKGGDA